MILTAETSLAQALRADTGLAGRLADALGPANPLSALLAGGNVPAGRIHVALFRRCGYKRPSERSGRACRGRSYA